jgi:acetylornithine deacetylase/succinyl-diaminopimelate desuccinylase-like protein
MTKVYTITINGKEEFLCGNIQKILLKSYKTGLDYWYQVNQHAIEHDVEGLFTDSPKWSLVVKDSKLESFKDSKALTLNLDVVARKFGIKGRWKNTSGWGHTSARHKSTATEFMVFTDRVSD